MLELITWLITLLIGGAVAFTWQKRGWKFQHKLRINADNHQLKTKLVTDIFSLVDKRVHASRLYFYAIKSGNTEDIKSERERYAAVVFEWNEKISGHLMLLRRYFDTHFSISFDDFFLPEFSETDSLLRNYRLNKMPFEIEGKLGVINEHARSMMHELIYDLEKERQVIEDRPDIYKAN